MQYDDGYYVNPTDRDGYPPDWEELVERDLAIVEEIADGWERDLIPCCDYRDHGSGSCVCPEHPASVLHPYGFAKETRR